MGLSGIFWDLNIGFAVYGTNTHTHTPRHSHTHTHSLTHPHPHTHTPRHSHTHTHAYMWCVASKPIWVCRPGEIAIGFRLSKASTGSINRWMARSWYELNIVWGMRVCSGCQMAKPKPPTGPGRLCLKCVCVCVFRLMGVSLWVLLTSCLANRWTCNMVRCDLKTGPPHHNN